MAYFYSLPTRSKKIEKDDLFNQMLFAIHNLMKNKNMTYEEAMGSLDIPKEKQRRYIQGLKRKFNVDIGEEEELSKHIYKMNPPCPRVCQKFCVSSITDRATTASDIALTQKNLHSLVLTAMRNICGGVVAFLYLPKKSLKNCMLKIPMLLYSLLLQYSFLNTLLVVVAAKNFLITWVSILIALSFNYAIISEIFYRFTNVSLLQF